MCSGVFSVFTDNLQFQIGDFARLCAFNKALTISRIYGKSRFKTMKIFRIIHDFFNKQFQLGFSAQEFYTNLSSNKGIQNS